MHLHRGLAHSQKLLRCVFAHLHSMQSQVDISNQLAAERANDNPVLELIRDIRQDINAGQSRIEDQLDDILGRQRRCVQTRPGLGLSISHLTSLWRSFACVALRPVPSIPSGSRRPRSSSLCSCSCL